MSANMLQLVALLCINLQLFNAVLMQSATKTTDDDADSLDALLALLCWSVFLSLVLCLAYSIAKRTNAGASVIANMEAAMLDPAKVEANEIEIQRLIKLNKRIAASPKGLMREEARIANADTEPGPVGCLGLLVEPPTSVLSEFETMLARQEQRDEASDACGEHLTLFWRQREWARFVYNDRTIVSSRPTSLQSKPRHKKACFSPLYLHIDLRALHRIGHGTI
jgi:hypothetical protein